MALCGLIMGVSGGFSHLHDQRLVGFPLLLQCCASLARVANDVVCHTADFLDIWVVGVAVVNKDLNVTVCPPRSQHVLGCLCHSWVVPWHEELLGLSLCLDCWTVLHPETRSVTSIFCLLVTRATPAFPSVPDEHGLVRFLVDITDNCRLNPGLSTSILPDYVQHYRR